MAAVSQVPHVLHPIAVAEDVGALRRSVARLAAGLGGLRPGQAELAATELATNLLRHADPGGYVLYRPCGEGIELISVDTGPGINPADIPTGRPDAVSPPVARGEGLGAGLASVRRLASEFDWYSTGGGTVILARLGVAPQTGRWRYGGLNVPLGGCGESGDAWTAFDDGRLAALVVDGLGHGPAAAAASAAASAAFARTLPTVLAGGLDPFVTRAHETMRATRGGVLALCVVDPDRRELIFAGVGNVAGQVVRGRERRHLLSRPGTLGTHLPLPRVSPQRLNWEPGSALVLVSDGIRSGWDPTAHPGLLDRDPVVAAAVLHRDHTRTTDDATVFIAREDTASTFPH